MLKSIDGKPKVLFVCLGNICRSPMAEGALRKACDMASMDCDIDSAGTGAYHIGNPPDPRAIAAARANGADISSLSARQLEHGDFYEFTHVFALDGANLQGIKAVAPRDGTAQIAMLMDLVDGSKGQPVIDPYYGDEGGFQQVWEQVEEAAKAFVAQFG